jgi:drug/metabolite transporter (DMT)-like permease
MAGLLQRVLMKNNKSHAAAYSSVFQLLGGLIILIAALINGFVLPPISTYPVNFVVMVLLYAGSTFFLFKALQTTEASIATIFGSTSSIWTIIIAILFLRESLNLSQFAGVILILLAVLLITVSRNKFQINQTVLYLLAYGACTGLGVANDAFILKHAEVFSYTALTWLFPALARLIIQPKAVYHMKPLLKSSYLIKMIILVCFAATSSVTFYLAYKLGGPISILSPMLSSAIILTVILAALFIGERDRLIRKLIAGAIAMAGILLIR